MPLTIYSEAVDEFVASMDEVKSYVRFLTLANHLRPWLGRVVDLGALEDFQKALVTEFMSQKNYTLDVGFDGAVVLIAGAFEQFVRRMLRDGVRWINGITKRFETLSPHIRQQHFIQSGHALVTINDPPAEVAYDYAAICGNLGTCKPDGGELVLNADVFTAFLGNLTPPNLEKALGRIGVEISWDAFGKDTDIRNVTGQTRPRDASNEAQKVLKDFTRRRNRIAHGGVGGVATTEEDLRSYLTFFRAFVRVLSAEAEKHLKLVHR